MVSLRHASLPVVAVLLAACSEPVAGPQEVDTPPAFSLHGGTPSNFGAVLTGAEEVPPVSTLAHGSAVFQLSADGTALGFRVLVANIENVTQAHIHCGGSGTNGPVVLFLYPAAPPAVLIPGRTDGILSEGVATSGNVIVRPDSEVCPGGVAHLDDLVEKMRTGGAYVNVHTSANPGGEIRGQIQARGPGA
jgi:hypothetical protein